jgi:hypothetical protein
MLNKEFAKNFSTEWVEAWNSHDLEKILSHYTEDFEMSSPYIVQVTGEPLSILKGKKAVGAYWEKGLALNPTLHFELLNTLVGVDSITLYYRSSRGNVAEVFFFNSENQVEKAAAHYE